MNILDALERQALHEALDDEYRSWATYDQVMTDFGAVRPFSNIREAESRHIEALCALFAAYGLPVPANPWPGKVSRRCLTWLTAGWSSPVGADSSFARYPWSSSTAVRHFGYGRD
jgi:hypothetical protein